MWSLSGAAVYSVPLFPLEVVDKSDNSHSLILDLSDHQEGSSVNVTKSYTLKELQFLIVILLLKWYVQAIYALLD